MGKNMKVKSYKSAFINKKLQTTNLPEYRLLQTVVTRTGLFEPYNRYPENINEKNSILK